MLKEYGRQKKSDEQEGKLARKFFELTLDFIGFRKNEAMFTWCENIGLSLLVSYFFIKSEKDISDSVRGFFGLYRLDHDGEEKDYTGDPKSKNRISQILKDIQKEMNKLKVV